jgi:hypothetical protein
MAKSTMDMIVEFKSFIDFVESLKAIDEVYWNKPLSEGKWSMKDVICHIMLWDKYFYEGAIEKIKHGEPVKVKHLNFNEFNANAREYAKNQTRDDIIDQFIMYREKIIADIIDLSEDEYIKEYKDGDKKKFTIRSYLRGFISHDKGHGKQIEKYIKFIN